MLNVVTEICVASEHIFEGEESRSGGNIYTFCLQMAHFNKMNCSTKDSNRLGRQWFHFEFKDL